MALPQELIDITLDHLHGDIPSLKACSLAARTFVHSARTHIFRRIEITPPLDSPSSNSCQRFHKLLSTSPHIAPLVEDLCIVLVGSETSFDHDAYNDDGEYIKERHVTWVMAGRTLSLVLPLLNLKRISLVENAYIDWNGGGEYSMDWTRMGRQLKSALAHVFSSPRLEAVHLRGMVLESPHQLLSLFSEATALREMSLSRLYFTQPRDQFQQWPESQPWCPQLRSLLVSDVYSDEFTRFLVNPRIKLAHVSRLSVSTYPMDWKNKIIQATKLGPSGGGVEHLRLWCHPVRQWSRDYFTANLRTVRLFSGSMFLLLDTVLKTCPRETRLEHITIEGRAYSEQIPSRPEFDAAIETAVDHLHALKTVELSSIIADSRFDSLAAWETVVQAALPSLVRRGMLRVTETECLCKLFGHGAVS